MLDAIDEDLNAGLITQEEADAAHARTHEIFMRNRLKVHNENNNDSHTNSTTNSLRPRSG